MELVANEDVNEHQRDLNKARDQKLIEHNVEWELHAMISAMASIRILCVDLCAASIVYYQTFRSKYIMSQPALDLRIMFSAITHYNTSTTDLAQLYIEARMTHLSLLYMSSAMKTTLPKRFDCRSSMCHYKLLTSPC